MSDPTISLNCAIAATLRRQGALNSMMTYVWIAVGSALGGVARYGCSGIAARTIGETFPIGTLIVNVAGSFVIGFFATLTGPDGRLSSARWRANS